MEAVKPYTGGFLLKRLRGKEIYRFGPCPISPPQIAILEIQDHEMFSAGESLENGKIIFVPTENLIR
jgi:hypothetical protein